MAYLVLGLLIVAALLALRTALRTLRRLPYEMSHNPESDELDGSGK